MNQQINVVLKDVVVVPATDNNGGRLSEAELQKRAVFFRNRPLCVVRPATPGRPAVGFQPPLQVGTAQNIQVADSGIVADFSLSFTASL